MKAYICYIPDETSAELHNVAKECYLKSEADKVIARNKYKRCLAIAKELEHVCPITTRKAKWRDNWHKRWLAIAEKFKEAK